MPEYSDINSKPKIISGKSITGKFAFNLIEYFYKEVYLD